MRRASMILALVLIGAPHAVLADDDDGVVYLLRELLPRIETSRDWDEGRLVVRHWGDDREYRRRWHDRDDDDDDDDDDD